MGLEGVSEGIKAYYEGATTMADIAKKAAAMEGADFVALILEGGDPNGVNKSIDELIAVVKEVADAVDCPLVVEGCKNVEKDAELLPKVAEALQGRNALILSEKEENYKAIGAAAGLAYNQIVGAESAVDINLAKQLNVVTTQLGVDAKKIVMNIGSAAVGYGYEYVVSTMDRIKGAALGQDDNMLQMLLLHLYPQRHGMLKRLWLPRLTCRHGDHRTSVESTWKLRQQQLILQLVLMQLS